jgi:hypothetical protein
MYSVKVDAAFPDENADAVSAQFIPNLVLKEPQTHPTMQKPEVFSGSTVI